MPEEDATPTRILALVPDAFGGHGGIALYNRNVLRALCELPSEPQVVAVPRLAPNLTEPLPENLDFRIRAKDSKPRFVFEALRAGIEARPEVIVCSHINLLPVAATLQRFIGARLVLFVYGIDAWTPRSRVPGWLVRRVDACIAIREKTIDALAGWTQLAPSRRHVLENAIHLERYGRAERRADLVEKYGLDGKRVLMTLGRVAHENLGFDEIVETLPALIPQVPNLVYLVVGDGAYLPTLRRKVSSLDLTDRVVFAGQVRDADKADHYRLADAFAMAGTHPTGWDDYPLRFVFLEALACGLPVVASRPSDLRDPDESPVPLIFVDAHDRDDLARGLLKALQRGPGPIPERLHDFDFPAFRTRLHRIVRDVMTPVQEQGGGVVTHREERSL